MGCRRSGGPHIEMKLWFPIFYFFLLGFYLSLSTSSALIQDGVTRSYIYIFVVVWIYELVTFNWYMRFILIMALENSTTTFLLFASVLEFGHRLLSRAPSVQMFISNNEIFSIFSPPTSPSYCNQEVRHRWLLLLHMFVVYQPLMQPNLNVTHK